MKRVLVAGASGHLGREVLACLKRRGGWHVRALTRDAKAAMVVTSDCR